VNQAGSVTMADRRGADRGNEFMMSSLKEKRNRDTGSFNAMGLKDTVLRCLEEQLESCMELTPVEYHPVVFQLGAGSYVSRPVSSYCFKEPFCIERRPPFEHRIDGTPEFLGDDGKCFSISVFADQFLVVVLSAFIPAKEETGCLAECPLQVDISDL
jgi:hypothetical protein